MAMSALRNYCCCCILKRDTDTAEFTVPRKWSPTLAAPHLVDTLSQPPINRNLHDQSDARYPVDYTELLNHETCRTEDDKMKLKERLKSVAKGFWEEALDGIPASRYSNRDLCQTYPIIFRLSRSLEFSTSQASIHPERSAAVVERHPLSDVRSVRRGVPGVLDLSNEHSLSIYLNTTTANNPSGFVGLLLASRQEQERFYISLSIFQLIATRLHAPRSAADGSARLGFGGFSETNKPSSTDEARGNENGEDQKDDGYLGTPRTVRSGEKTTNSHDWKDSRTPLTIPSQSIHVHKRGASDSGSLSDSIESCMSPDSSISAETSIRSPQIRQPIAPPRIQLLTQNVFS